MIVEQGSGIFIPQDNCNLITTEKAVQWLSQNYRAVSKGKVFTVGIGPIDRMNSRNSNIAAALDVMVPVTISTDQDWQNDFITAWIELVRQICRDYFKSKLFSHNIAVYSPNLNKSVIILNRYSQGEVAEWLKAAPC